jgi:hypothetical protein
MSLQLLLRKINELPNLKQQYIFIMLRLASVKGQKQEEFATGLIVLLRNIVNYDKNEILTRLADALESVLISYFFDQDNLINNKLEIELYETKHINLLLINKKVEQYAAMYNVDYKELEDFKDTLYDV